MDIRELKSTADLKAVEEMQRIVWGSADLDILSPLSLRASIETGALLLGAFDGPTMAGFLYAFPGYHDGQIELHSDMTGLRPEYRDRGLGYRLKLAQREWALERGIPIVTWTFDPLRSRNAYFNFRKLGAISSSYRVNFYGEDSTSFLHRNATDRLWVTWELDSARVRDRLGGLKPPPIDAPAVVSIGPEEEPVHHPVGMDSGQVSIHIPLDPDKLETALAVQWREVTRATFQEWIGAGFTVTDAHLGRYLLEQRVERQGNPLTA